jgi:hypothetical protein
VTELAIPEIRGPLADLEAAVQLLANSRDLNEVRQIRDMAEAARLYAIAIERGLEAQNHAAEIKIRAERRAGELLAGMDLNGNRFSGPRLEPLGIEKHESHRWQQIARVPEERFEAHLETVKAAGRELSSAGVYALARDMRPVPEPRSRLMPESPLLRFCQDLPTPTIVSLILAVCFSDAETALDMTYGRGNFWDGSAHVRITAHDALAERAPNGAADFRHLPYPPRSFDVVLFDPPHLPDGGADSIMATRYGTYTYAELMQVIPAGVLEAWRLARLGIVVKVTDAIHDEQLQLESDWVREALGWLRPYDLVHQVRPRALVNSRWEEQLSAYNNGASFLVFRRNPRHVRRQAI